MGFGGAAAFVVHRCFSFFGSEVHFIWVNSVCGEDLGSSR